MPIIDNLNFVVSISLIVVMYIIPLVQSMLLLQKKSQNLATSSHSKWITYWIEITAINIAECFLGFLIPIPYKYFCFIKLLFCSLLVMDRFSDKEESMHESKVKEIQFKNYNDKFFEVCLREMKKIWVKITLFADSNASNQEQKVDFELRREIYSDKLDSNQELKTSD